MLGRTLWYIQQEMVLRKPVAFCYGSLRNCTELGVAGSKMEEAGHTDNIYLYSLIEDEK